MTNLIWFREDLRTLDNTAFYHASTLSNNGIIAIYFLTPKTWQQHDMAACRVDFILRGLIALSKELAKLNVPLLIRTADSIGEIEKQFIKIIKQYKIQAIFFNKQYKVDESIRDVKLINSLKTYVTINSYHDQCIIPPGKVLTKQGDMFKVFTPFKKSWLGLISQYGQPVHTPSPQLTLSNIHSDSIPKFHQNFKSNIDPALWPAGQKAALKRLDHFITEKIEDYEKNHDFPCMDATSKLSPYLATGMLSARQCLQAALAINQGEITSGNKGVITWLNELIWREFYRHILVAYPRVGKHQAFKTITDKIPWNKNQAHIKAWKTGTTGFPIIDAAMRQLNTTGWMHNRLRMITAMFFSKNLLLDWRLGEKYFMQHLIDGDLASNNGGWQWSASTGTDAAPYFRIFNPIRQSQRFDPSGEFIRHYCPELQALDTKMIHNPYEYISTALNYPKPIVDLNETRQYAIAIFKQANAHSI